MMKRFAALVVLLISPVVWTVQPSLVLAESASRQTAQQASDSKQATYEQAMRIGYEATEQRDYQTALINFRRALAARPGDRYATAAIDNVQSYIDQIRAIEARNQQIQTLQATLEEAIAASDWVCAAGAIDRLVPLLPPDSWQQTNLIAYRGELSGLLETRRDFEQWSTVCGLAPLHS